MSSSSLARLPSWFWIWAGLVGVMLLLRPALPVDETRYLAVAWEMWWRDSIAVPYLNGGYYDGKPPLFFWLMQLGWWVFGVNEWWPRLLAPLFGLGALLLVRAIAGRLWPNHAARETAPLILLGSFYWAVFCASTMFDMLLGFFALLSVYAVIRAWQDGDSRYFILAGLALGGGLLAKGPVVFLPALFIVLSAPWWAAQSRMERLTWRRWFFGALGAAGISVLVALAWLIPMALGSDMAYLKNMTVHQTAGYVTESFSHRRPIWWYLTVLPFLLFPWSFWPRAWLALGAVKTMSGDPGMRLCVVWAVTVLIVFSLISGKQAHYPLLMFPAVALLLARLLPELDRGRDGSLLAPAIALIAVGALWIAAGRGMIPAATAAWLNQMPFHVPYVAGASLIGLGFATALARRSVLNTRITVLAAASCAMVLVLAWGVMRASWPAYDMRPASAYLSRVESRGAPLAIAGSYDGQFNFYGRIKVRIEKITAAAAESWAFAHPDGYIIALYTAERWPLRAEPAPAFQGLYRGGGMAIWRAQDITRHPQLAQTFR